MDDEAQPDPASGNGEAPAPAGPERTPRAALAALRPQARKVGIVSIGPITLEHWIALQTIESPVVIPSGKITARDLVNAAGLLSIRAETLSPIIEGLREQAWAAGSAIATLLLPKDFPDLAEAVNGCILDGFATHIPVKPVEGEGREKKVPAAGSSISSKPSGG